MPWFKDVISEKSQSRIDHTIVDTLNKECHCKGMIWNLMAIQILRQKLLYHNIFLNSNNMALKQPIKVLSRYLKKYPLLAQFARS